MQQLGRKFGQTAVGNLEIFTSSGTEPEQVAQKFGGYQSFGYDLKNYDIDSSSKFTKKDFSYSCDSLPVYGGIFSESAK